MNVLNTNDKVAINGDRFTVNIQNGMPVVYVPATSLDFDHWANVNVL